MTTTLLRQESEVGIEFFTVEATGESGMSQTCLGLLSGVSQQAIDRLEKTLTTKSPSEQLEPWMGKALTLTTNNNDFEIDGKPVGNLTIYRSEFCSAVIQHYAFKGNKVAQHSLTKFSTSGIDTWIQQQTGWQPQNAIPAATPTTALLLPEIPKKKLAIKLVNDEAFRSNLQHQFLFRQAYNELNYRFGYDIYHKRCKGSKLDRIEEDKQLDNLIAIMQNLWAR